MLRLLSSLLLGLYCLFLFGCGSFLPSSGPRSSTIKDAGDSKRMEGIHVVELDSKTLARFLQAQQKQGFADAFAAYGTIGHPIGKGDVLAVAIWEVAPALFGGSLDPRGSNAAANGTFLPEQMVDEHGTITIPFVGPVKAAGLTIEELQHSIAASLEGKANQPQVLVKMVRSVSAGVTVVGEVSSSVRMPLTARGECLLDAIAAAGGTRHPVEKMTVQLTRDGQAKSMACEHILRDPRQNIRLKSNDVVTLFYKPHSFTALGATGRNEEVDFEATGISLAQALGRVGGLQENSANARGVFLFRFESPAVLADAIPGSEREVKAKKSIPVVYRIDMKDPASFFLAQQFTMQDKDILFVAHASSADLKKFLGLLVSVVYPIENFTNFMNIND